ncbi:MAG: thiamine phosphate synthase, partial [Sphingomonas sp.]
MTDDPLGPLDPDFAVPFQRDRKRPPCQLYLVSPLDVGGGFPDRRARALDADVERRYQVQLAGR